MLPADDAALFTPDWVHPIQVPSGARRDSLVSGERALMLAILEDALRCLERRRSDAREAAAWIASDDREWPCSFLNVCDALDLDPGALRAGIRMRDGGAGARPDRWAPLPGRRRARAARSGIPPRPRISPRPPGASPRPEDAPETTRNRVTLALFLCSGPREVC